MQNLIKYLESNYIQYTELSKETIQIADKTCYLVKPDEDGLLFDEAFELLVDKQNCDLYVFKFGDRWYYCEDPYKVKLNILKHIGNATLDEQFPFLGIHGKYELLNGSRSYEDWCKKANFLGIETLGICEKNTLAGVLNFQSACLSNGITPILGATYTVNRDDYRYDVKVYVKNKKGWESILKINKEVKIVNNNFINEDVLLKNLKGLYLILDPKSIEFENIFPIDITQDIYYQLDTVEYVNGDRDKWYLENLKKFVHSEHKPILITDAYYLDQEDAYIKDKLNAIGSFKEYNATNQYFKPNEDYLEELIILFKDSDLEENGLFDTTYQQALENLLELTKRCNFIIDTTQRHLPKYKMTEEESKQFKTNEDLFWHLIEKGIEKKGIEDDVYFERIEEEFEVIKLGEVVDYFLITWDIINWARENNILVGIGRGSLGGTLLGYLLELHQLDPLEYGLLFSRFLNKGRVQVSMPDADIDFEGGRRNDVKAYMEQRFGVHQVCSVSTYGTFQIKALLKDLARLENFSVGEMNYITSVLDLEDGSLTDLFKNGSKNARIKKFIQDHLELVNSIDLIANQPKNTSIHACATIIVPKEKEIYDWFPVKWGERDGEKMIVTEWEGGELDNAGFLKSDILGIKQLDKFASILHLIESNRKESVDIYNLPKKDKSIFKYFQNGWNKDVFQFGTKGLTDFCKQMKPENLDDLIAAVALYRPGAMENNFHNEYILRKNEGKEFDYLYGSEKITKDTYGIYCYQEQVMQLCTDVGGFDLVEADSIRKALGKKDINILNKYKEQFIKGALKINCPKNEAEDLWSMMQEFAKYSFNKSHSVAYAITGYISQYLKVHYPIEFWTTAFTFGGEDDYAGYISEIFHTGSIKLSPPDINISGRSFSTDFKTDTIFWSLQSIKQCGEKAIEEIEEMRKEHGEYFSFEEFLSRHDFKGSKVNKSVIENLITCGAFDKLEGLTNQRSRYKLITLYRDTFKVKIDKTKDLYTLNSDLINEEWWWSLQQKKLCGYAFFDYPTLVNQAFPTIDLRFTDAIDLMEKESVDVNVKTGGYVTEFIPKNSKKKGNYCQLVVEHNYEFFNVTVWPEQYEVLEEMLQESKKNIILLSGTIKFDSYKKQNIIVLNNNSEIFLL